MMKFIGLVLIFSFFSIGGHMLALRRKREIEREEAMLSLIRHIRRNAGYYRMPLSDIYKCFYVEAFEKNGFLQDLRENGLKETYLLHQREFQYDSFIESILLSFAENPGMLPLEELLLSCDRVEAELDARIKQIKSEFPAKQKLYLTLGITLGIGAVILFL